MLNSRAREILEECGELLERKGADYNGGGLVNEEDYFKFEEHCPNLKIMHTKVMRYASLCSQEGSNFESKEDTLRDLINYASLSIAYLEKYRK